MKGSTVLWIAGGVIIAGVVTYGIYKYLKHQEDDTTQTSDNPAPDRIIISDATSDDVFQHETIATDFIKTQQDAATSIKSRHQAAAQQLTETLGELEKDSVEFKEKMDQINDGLDKLLE